MSKGHCQVNWAVTYGRMDLSKPLYYRRRFPAEIISHCVWLYFRFCLSYRDVEEMMAERGIVVTYETIRDWSQKFGGTYAKRLRSRTPRPGDRWHLDEVYLSINGRLPYLWRAVDQDGEVLDILVQPLRNRQAAKKFFRKLLHRLQYIPRAIITDKLLPPRRRYCPMSSTYKINERTIARRIPTGQRESENVACGVPSRPGMPSGFSRPMG